MGFGIVSTDRSTFGAASGNPVRYRSGFLSPSSCGETPAPSEDAGAGSFRPLACDFRRLRFSRNARFSRSCLESLVPAGRFAAVGCCPSPLFFSSAIVDLFGQPRMIEAWHGCHGNASAGTASRLLTTPRCCRRCCRSISYFTRPSCNSDSRTARLARAWALWQGSARPVGPIGRFPWSGHAAVAQW
jgi:hypothetical protein